MQGNMNTDTHAVSSQAPQDGQPSRANESGPRLGPLRVGVDYYPEHWDPERWPEDVRLMREAGIKVVRLAEFAWSRMEPAEGQFHFDWLENAVDLMAGAGITVVLGTPTAAPPAWLHQKYPDIYPMDEWRRPLGFGSRLQRCVNHPAMREHSRRVTTAMAERFGKHPAVEAWQTDNELTQNYCYCDHCARGFREWLAQKYGSLDALNKAWGTVFWSQEYTEWGQIPLPWVVKCGTAHNPSLQLDFRRFQSDATVSFQREQVEILRALCPGQRVTHNIMGLNDSMDYRRLAEDWDFATWDNYPVTPWGASGMRVPLGHDFTRGVKNRCFWVMEEQCGITGWDTMGPQPAPGQVRAWAWQAVSHGADTLVFFRWRSCLSGTEQYWHGILNHDGIPRRRYHEITGIARDLEAATPHIGGASVVSEVAVLHAADQHYAYHIQPQARGLGLWDQMLRFYNPLWAMGVNMDVVSPADDLSGYKLVILPGWHILDNDTADRLRRYVEDGGTLVMNPRTGVKNDCNVCVELPLPGLLRDVAGVTVEEYNPLGDMTETVELADGTEAKVSVWADLLAPDTAETIVRYKDALYAGMPAVTRNRFGSGTAWYFGTFGEEAFYKPLLTDIMSERGIALMPSVPNDVSMRVMRRDGKGILIAVNLCKEERCLDIPSQYVRVFGDDDPGPGTLPGFGVAVFAEQ